MAKKSVTAHTEIDAYLKHLEELEARSLGKSIEWLLNQAGGELYEEDSLEKEYYQWRNDNPLEASIWDEVKRGASLPMELSDWKSWQRCYDTNQRILQNISYTLKAVDNHVKALCIKRAFEDLFTDMDPKERNRVSIAFNARKGFSLDENAFKDLSRWLFSRANDKDVLDFNVWASRNIATWPERLFMLFEKLTMDAWWGRRKSEFSKAVSSHIDNAVLYRKELENAVRIHCLCQEDVRSWFLDKFAKKGVTANTIKFEIFM